MGVYCTSCGSETGGADTFCRDCGEPLDNETVQEEPTKSLKGGEDSPAVGDTPENADATLALTAAALAIVPGWLAAITTDAVFSRSGTVGFLVWGGTIWYVMSDGSRRGGFGRYLTVTAAVVAATPIFYFLPGMLDAGWVGRIVMWLIVVAVVAGILAAGSRLVENSPE